MNAIIQKNPSDVQSYVNFIFHSCDLVLMDNKEKLLERFGKHLSKLREAQGLSIRQFAAESGLEYSQVQRIEKGKVNLAFTTLISLSQGLGVEVSKLLEGFKIPR